MFTEFLIAIAGGAIGGLISGALVVAVVWHQAEVRWEREVEAHRCKDALRRAKPEPRSFK